jgi:hypothetical protein
MQNLRLVKNLSFGLQRNFQKKTEVPHVVCIEYDTNYVRTGCGVSVATWQQMHCAHL